MESEEGRFEVEARLVGRMGIPLSCAQRNMVKSNPIERYLLFVILYLIVVNRCFYPPEADLYL